MSERDGTGPVGTGALTGRGSGSCIIPSNTKKVELTYLKNQR